MNPCKVSFGTKEYKNLKAVASLLDAMKEKDYIFVEDTYFDYGQNWVWTTILAHTKYSDVQIITPREWEKIIVANSISELAQIAKEISRKDILK